MSGGMKMKAGKATLIRLLLAAALAPLLITVGIAQACGGTITGTVTSPGGYPLPTGTRVKLFELARW